MPVSITEFSVHTDNVTLRADELEKAITVYFSEECVQGILLWGFSDQPPLAFRKDSALTTGINFVVRYEFIVYCGLHDNQETIVILYFMLITIMVFMIIWIKMTITVVVMRVVLLPVVSVILYAA